MNLLLPMTISGLLVTGMGVALLGSVMIPLARRLDIDEARVGGLVSIFGFAMIPVVLTAGFLTDHVGKQTVLTGGSLLMAASLVLLARSRVYSTALVSVLLFSASWSAMINVINVLTPLAFLESSESENRMSYATNLANVFFGMGAFFTPLLTGMLINRKDMSTALLVIASIVLVPMLLAIGVDFEAIENEASPAESEWPVSSGIP